MSQLGVRGGWIYESIYAVGRVGEGSWAGGNPWKGGRREGRVMGGLETGQRSEGERGREADIAGS